MRPASSHSMCVSPTRPAARGTRPSMLRRRTWSPGSLPRWACSVPVSCGDVGGFSVVRSGESESFEPRLVGRGRRVVTELATVIGDDSIDGRPGYGLVRAQPVVGRCANSLKISLTLWPIRLQAGPAKKMRARQIGQIGQGCTLVIVGARDAWVESLVAGSLACRAWRSFYEARGPAFGDVTAKPIHQVRT